MRRPKEIYERLRPLIVWLGLTELAWISYWLLRPGDPTAGYLTTVAVWIAAMLAWMGLRRHTRLLSSPIAVTVFAAGFHDPKGYMKLLASVLLADRDFPAGSPLAIVLMGMERTSRDSRRLPMQCSRTASYRSTG